MSGKRQRPAHFQIDQKTLQYKDNPEPSKEGEKDKQESIKQRKIYKIKTPGQPKQVVETKPKFTLFGSSQKSQKTDLSIQQKTKENQATKQDEPASEKKQEQKSEPEKKPFTFSFGTSGFGGFGNGIGIFTNPDKGEGIFSKNNIFSHNNNQGSSIFSKPDSTAKPSGLVFGTTQSIFNFSSSGVPPIKKQGLVKNNNEEEEGDGDSAELQNDQKQTIDPSKSTGNYQYNSDCDILFQHKILKFKRNQGEVLENTEIIVQHDKEKQSSWVNVRLCATKNPILTGFLIKGKSQIKKLGNKDENIVLSVLTIKDKQPVQTILKLQFQSPKIGIAFKQAVQKLLN